MKTIWGLEPKNQTDAALKGMARLLGQFSRSAKDLSVAYVVTGNESYLYTAFDVPEDERFSTYPKSLILKELEKADVPLKPNKVDILHHTTLSTTTAVDQLLKFAGSKRAKLLALFTHNKKGLERMFMGSFAETAVHRSRIDLLLAGPGMKFPDQVRSVLYASDFGPDSKRELRRVLEICKHLRASLTVFHAALITYRWSLDDSSPRVKAYRKKTDAMTHWIETECKKARVPVTVVIEAELDFIPDQVFETARKAKADLIVASAKVGPFGALMGGSVTRNIVRQGTHPVLVLKR